MENLLIHNKALLLAIIFAILGFIFTMRTWILWLDKLNPLQGLVIYYIIVTITIVILQKIGLIVGGIEFQEWNHTIGILLLYFSWHIIFNDTSCYINMVTKGQCDQKKISTVFLNSEDGSTYYLWSKITTNIEYLRLLTYVITPFILTFIGVLLIQKDISLSLF